MASEKGSKNPNQPRARTKSAKERVRRFLEFFEGNDIVLIHINPDPDSIASAFAIKRLLWKHTGKTLIAYINEIQRLENRAMVELLKIPLIKLQQAGSEHFTRHILIDSQPNHSEIFQGFSYDAIIDHHPWTKKWECPFVDIRPEYGATATILIEYIRAAGIKPSMYLATALIYAIKTDTANFERDATEEDVKQFRYIFKYSNSNLLRKIEQSELKASDLHYFHIALEKRIITKKAIYAHIGEVSNPDICVQIADFFMRVYGVSWSFVSGIYRGTLVVIIRNDGYRKDAGKLAANAFGEFGSAGGHRGAARAEMALDSLQQKGVLIHDSALKSFIRERLKF